MPTVSAGSSVTVYCPLASDITVTPGTSGRVSIQARSQNGGQSFAPREMYVAGTISAQAGDTLSIEAINVDATYTAPAGLDTALQALVSGAGNPYLRFCLPGREASGTQFKDVGPLANHGTVGAGNTAAFTTAEFIGATAAVNGGVTVPNSAIAANIITGSFIVAFAMRNATPGANASMMSLAGRAGSFCGVYLSHRTTGAMRVVVNRGNGTLVSSPADSTLLFSTATATFDQPYRHCVLAFDGPSGSAYLYRDGVLCLSNVGLVAPGGGSAVIGGDVLEQFAIGSQAEAGATAFAGLYRGVQVYVFPNRGLPLNIGAAANDLAKLPESPLPYNAFQF